MIKPKRNIPKVVGNGTVTCKPSEMLHRGRVEGQMAIRVVIFRESVWVVNVRVHKVCMRLINTVAFL